MCKEQNDENVEVPAAIRTGIEKVFEEQLGSRDVDVVFERGTKKGDNYIGIIYRATGKVNSAQNNDKKELKLIAKVAPQQLARREQFRPRVCFMREIKMYLDVFPMFRLFQESRGIIPEENGFHETPICYKTIDDDMNESLIFQDLHDCDFHMFDRLVDLPIDHVMLVMRTLGKFHALSFALRDQSPELLKQHSVLPEPYIRKNDPSTQRFYDMVLVNVYEALSDPADVRLLKKLKDLMSKGYTLVTYANVSGASAEPYSVICHGDCWTNNMLFRYDENGKPIELRFLDFQLSRYASPITDVVYFLFCSTTKNLRDKYYNEVLREYYNSLSEMLKRLGSDPAKLFPFNAMHNQLKEFGIFGLLSAIVMLNFTVPPPEDCFDMDELAKKFEKGDIDEKLTIKVNANVQQRMRDAVIDMDRLGYF